MFFTLYFGLLLYANLRGRGSQGAGALTGLRGRIYLGRRTSAPIPRAGFNAEFQR